MTEGETPSDVTSAAPADATPATPPPPLTPITIFVSGSSGSKVMLLVDISAPGTEKKRTFMREKALKKADQRNVLPPQVFNGDKYCGDYEAFDIANEDDELEEFLGLPRKTPKEKPETKPAEGAATEKETDDNTTIKNTTVSAKVVVEEICKEEEEEFEESEDEDTEEVD